MNMKESREGYMSVLWGKREKGRKKCHNNNLISKLTEKENERKSQVDVER